MVVLVPQYSIGANRVDGRIDSKTTAANGADEFTTFRSEQVSQQFDALGNGFLGNDYVTPDLIHQLRRRYDVWRTT